MSSLYISINNLIKTFQQESGQFTALWAMEKVGKDPFLILLAIVLSQNTNDKNSIRAFNNLLEEGFTTPDKFLSTDDEKIINAIKIAGQYNNRLKTIKNLSVFFSKNVELIRDICVNVIETRKNMLNIWGIGEKTADVFLSLYCDTDEVFPVDRHILRITSRLIGKNKVSYSEASAFWKDVVRKVRDEGSYKLHISLIDLGRKVCRPRNPRCDICPLHLNCVSSSLLFKRSTA